MAGEAERHHTQAGAGGGAQEMSQAEDSTLLEEAAFADGSPEPAQAGAPPGAGGEESAPPAAGAGGEPAAADAMAPEPGAPEPGAAGPGAAEPEPEQAGIDLDKIQVRIDFRIGEVILPVSALSGLTPGFTLTDLPAVTFPRVQALAQGRVFAEGELIELDGKIGFRIQKILD